MVLPFWFQQLLCTISTLYREVAMLILNYFRQKDSASKDVFLPVPSNPSVESANTCVGDLASKPASKCRKVIPHTYDAKTRAQILLESTLLIMVCRQLYSILLSYVATMPESTDDFAP